MAGSFFDQEFWVRKTNGAANTAWSRMITSSNIGTNAIQNQNAAAQTVANFWISGNGQANKFIASANGDWYFQGGDDARLHDVNVANTVGIVGMQNAALGAIQLGNNTATYIAGSGGNIGIGTVSPGYKLHVAGDIYANGGWATCFW